MSLGKQLTLAVSAIFFVALLGVQAIHLRSAQSHLQAQLESTAQDAATSIGLSLGALMRGVDAALAQTVVNPAFDRGHYQRIEYLSPGGERLVSRILPPQRGAYPAWFVELFPLHSPTAQSLVSAGWQQLGRVEVTPHPRFAYEQLWGTARDTFLYLVLIYAAALIALRVFLRSLLRPLAAVEQAALAISARNFVELRIKPPTRELARVVQAMNTLSSKVNEAIEQETRRAAGLQAAAHRDPVTGLLNSRGFSARFESVFEGEEHPFGGTLALVEFADLGDINRELGPERCNQLLRELYRQMDETVKEAGGFAGRWTGALTIMAMTQVKDDAARGWLARLRMKAASTLKEYAIDRAERIYCGAVQASGAPTSLRALTRSAEEALLQAREAAEGIALVAAHSTEAPVAEDDPLIEIREALEQRRLQLVGQEAWRMSDHRLLHTEILARLRNAQGREMAAAQFMPIVAAHGLVQQLDRGVIERVIEGARGGDGALSINVSMHCAEQPQFVGWLARLLERERGIARRLVFEIAEHGVVSNQTAAHGFAAAVRRAGAEFALDHFGVHRDSLALLQRLRPAYIKLAAAHTSRMVDDAGERFFAESLTRAARQLDIPVIAQRVEDDSTFQALGALGFSGYQGNLISPPAPWP
jgi:EAL domain-containing protein (putative c-di-GMP-specific phosphodiesterase class I)/GGDEF domain-containing protein